VKRFVSVNSVGGCGQGWSNRVVLGMGGSASRHGFGGFGAVRSGSSARGGQCGLGLSERADRESQAGPVDAARPGLVGHVGAVCGGVAGTGLSAR
jgi:hypothetical protein